MIEGVAYSNSTDDKVHVFVVHNLSSEFKELIKNRFVSVCKGVAYYQKFEEISFYKDTLKDFVERYESKQEEQKMGLIGELLAHILIFQCLPEYKSVAPFFNMEDKGPRKGFDLVLYREANSDMCYVEVKSGQGYGDTSANESKNLISRAKSDLLTKLSDQKRNHWNNAINSARLACYNNRKLADAVEEILAAGLREAEGGTVCGSSKNVALVSVLYKHVDEKINLDDVKPVQERIVQSRCFNDLVVLSMQKSTYDKVYQLIKAEAEQ